MTPQGNSPHADPINSLRQQSTACEPDRIRGEARQEFVSAAMLAQKLLEADKDIRVDPAKLSLHHTVNPIRWQPGDTLYAHLEHFRGNRCCEGEPVLDADGVGRNNMSIKCSGKRGGSHC
jgi:hypothetical protein